MLYAYVCSGERIDGKVKSRTLAYLGSIAPDAIERASARAEFWYQVTSNLEKLAQSSQLKEEELAKLTTAIAQKVEPVEVPVEVRILNVGSNTATTKFVHES
ncbi:hypothetical protein [Planktothrix sp. FACHB-1355]|uniref:hypothetical protein n=1 Tax=Planktothrix sp. FACHB-1355 TaxID=2692854 RepID=UPI00168B0C1D|nr:hypothetical protein [Planktothrix sp. FACHB-1355]